MNEDPSFIELLKRKQGAKHNAYQNKVTSQNTMLHVQSMTGILLIPAKQENVEHFFLLEQPYEIGPRSSFGT